VSSPPTYKSPFPLLIARASTPSPFVPFDCGDGTIISQSSICDFITDCPNGRDEKIYVDCTFEQGTCTWLDVSVGAFAWKHGQCMNVAPLHSGPIIDHTTQTSLGYYMYIRTSDGVVWNDAILE